MAYAPAGNNSYSSGLAHLQSIYYKKTGLDRLVKKFKFREPCMEDELPKQSGRTVQWFRYMNFGTNTTPNAVEGSVGSSATFSSRIVTATVSEYSNFLSLSKLLNDTALDDTLTNAAGLLGYQAGLSVDTITRNVIDAEAANVDQALLGSYMKVADLRNVAHQLMALDVEPMSDGKFFCIMHPYVSYDVINDPAAGGLADIFKYTNPEKAGLVESTGEAMFEAGDCRVVRSTNVTKVAGSPNKWRTYIFGKNGIGTVALSGSAPTDVKDPNKQRFQVNIIRTPSPSNTDPEGNIAGYASYRYVYTAVVLDGPSGIGGTYRFRKIDAPSTIAA